MKIRYLVLSGVILLVSLGGVFLTPAPEPINSYGHTPLYTAVIAADVKQVERLLKNGADVNFQTPEKGRVSRAGPSLCGCGP